MTRPNTSSKLLLVADTRPSSAGPPSVPIRRFRLARVRFDGRATTPANRFDHLKHVHD